MAAENVDRIPFGTLSGKQGFDIGENLALLVIHMLVHLGDILVEEAQDGKGHVVAAAVDGLDQLAANARQPEIEEIVVGIAQIAHQRSDRNSTGIGSFSVDMRIDHGQERPGVDPAVAADFADRLVAEAQRDAETAHDKQYGVAVADQIAHAVVGIVSSNSIHKILNICKISDSCQVPQYLISGILPAVSGFRCRYRWFAASYGPRPSGRERSLKPLSRSWRPRRLRPKHRPRRSRR